MDVMQIYRESNLNLIATTLLILKKSQLNFNYIIFEKYCNMGFSIGNENGIWKYGYEAINLIKWLLIDKYYDNINFFDLIYSIMNKDKTIIITSEDFSFVNELTK